MADSLKLPTKDDGPSACASARMWGEPSTETGRDVVAASDPRRCAHNFSSICAIVSEWGRLSMVPQTWCSVFSSLYPKYPSLASGKCTPAGVSVDSWEELWGVDGRDFR